MTIGHMVSRFGAALAIIGAIVGYFGNSVFLTAVDCEQGTYSLTCATYVDRLAFLLGNFGNVAAAFICALPGLALHFLFAPKDQSEGSSDQPS